VRRLPLRTGCARYSLASLQFDGRSATLIRRARFTGSGLTLLHTQAVRPSAIMSQTSSPNCMSPTGPRRSSGPGRSASDTEVVLPDDCCVERKCQSWLGKLSKSLEPIFHR
jgi:hypothetical protein